MGQYRNIEYSMGNQTVHPFERKILKEKFGPMIEPTSLKLEEVSWNSPGKIT